MPVDGASPYSIGSTVWPGLSKVVEELGELAQVLGKILATGHTEHWQGDLLPHLRDELGDVRAALDYFTIANRLDAHAIIERQAEKFRLFDNWHREAARERQRTKTPAPSRAGGDQPEGRQAGRQASDAQAGVPGEEPAQAAQPPTPVDVSTIGPHRQMEPGRPVTAPRYTFEHGKGDYPLGPFPPRPR